MTQNKTNMTAEELAKSIVLKPCPFCGSAAEFYRGMFDAWNIYCTKCTARMYSNENISNPKIIANEWNRRVADE